VEDLVDESDGFEAALEDFVPESEALLLFPELEKPEPEDEEELLFPELEKPEPEEDLELLLELRDELLRDEELPLDDDFAITGATHSANATNQISPKRVKRCFMTHPSKDCRVCWIDILYLPTVPIKGCIIWLNGNEFGIIGIWNGFLNGRHGFI
jgi:hypothetical protein